MEATSAQVSITVFNSLRAPPSKTGGIEEPSVDYIQSLQETWQNRLGACAEWEFDHPNVASTLSICPDRLRERGKMLVVGTDDFFTAFTRVHIWEL